MNIVFKWQTSCIPNAVAYGLLRLWRSLVMKLHLHVKLLIFHWVLGFGISPWALMSLPLSLSSGQLVVLHALWCRWGLGGSRHSCKDAVTPSHNCKMASKDLSCPLSLEVRAACLSLHTQLLPMCWLDCEGPRSLICPMLPSCSYYHLPAPPSPGKSSFVCSLCLKHCKTCVFPCSLALSMWGLAA